MVGPCHWTARGARAGARRARGRRTRHAFPGTVARVGSDRLLRGRLAARVARPSREVDGTQLAATVAVRAVGPLDATIRPVTLESPEVLAIGACSPATVDGAGRTNLGGPTQVIRAWRVSAGRATPLALATHRDEVLPGVATLYRPEATIAARDAGDGWPAGDFVLEVVPVGQADGRADPGSGQHGRREPAPAPGWFVGLVVRGHG